MDTPSKPKLTETDYKLGKAAYDAFVENDYYGDTAKHKHWLYLPDHEKATWARVALGVQATQLQTHTTLFSTQTETVIAELVGIRSELYNITHLAAGSFKAQ
jgi:hypothetical protein